MVEFLKARIDEDEQVARDANVKQDDLEWWCSPVLAAQLLGEHGAVTVRSRRDNRPIARVRSESADQPADILDGTAVAAHIAQHDPKRTLREVTAKRAIVADHAALSSSVWCRICDPGFSNQDAYYPCRTVRIIAAVYVDHPDYRQEWKP